MPGRNVVLPICAFLIQLAHAFVPASFPHAVATARRGSTVGDFKRNPLRSPLPPFRIARVGHERTSEIRRKETAMSAATALSIVALPPITLKSILLLTATISLSLCGACSMKLSNSFKNIIPSVLMFVFYCSSFSLFTVTLQYWPISIAYAIWSGVGTAAMGVIGSVWFGERLKWPQYFGILCIIVGTVCINL